MLFLKFFSLFFILKKIKLQRWQNQEEINRKRIFFFFLKKKNLSFGGTWVSEKKREKLKKIKIKIKSKYLPSFKKKLPLIGERWEVDHTWKITISIPSFILFFPLAFSHLICLSHSILLSAPVSLPVTSRNSATASRRDAHPSLPPSVSPILPA